MNTAIKYYVPLKNIMIRKTIVIRRKCLTIARYLWLYRDIYKYISHAYVNAHIYTYIIYICLYIIIYVCVYTHIYIYLYDSNYGVCIEKILEEAHQNTNNCLIRKVK